MIAAPLAVDVGNDLIYVVAAIPLLIAIAVAFAVWNNARKEGVVQGLQVRLSSTDREVRRRALDDVNDEILNRNAALFCDLLANEDDPEVLDALAAAVARSKWEPSNDPSLVELRRWVAGGEAARTRSSAPSAASAVEPAPEAASTPGAPPAVEHDGVPASPAVADATAAAGAAAVTAVLVSTTGDAEDPAHEGVDATRVVVAAEEPATGATGAIGAEAADEPERAPRASDLDELVPKVNAVLGGGLERLELVSIDGEVLTRWSSSEEVSAARDAEGVDA